MIKLQAKIATIMENPASCLASTTTAERLRADASRQEEVAITEHSRPQAAGRQRPPPGREGRASPDRWKEQGLGWRTCALSPRNTFFLSRTPEPALFLNSSPADCISVSWCLTGTFLSYFLIAAGSLFNSQRRASGTIQTPNGSSRGRADFEL